MRLISEQWQELRQISSTNGKKEYLKQITPNMEQALVYALDPFRRYKMTTKVTGQGVKAIDELGWFILTSLADANGVANEVKSDVETYIMGLSTDEAECFKDILHKKPRLGCAAELVNDVFPGLIPQHKVMRAKLIDWSRVKYPCCYSNKIDGTRAVYRKGKFYFRNGKTIPGLSYLENLLHDSDEVLDGELLIPDMIFQDSDGEIRSSRECPTAQYHIFEMPELVDRSFGDRIKYMKDIVAYVNSPNVAYVPHYRVYTQIQLEDAYLQARKEGYEGIMVKPIDYVYRDSRNYDWMKMKPKDTLDLPCTGFFEGTGKYERSLGGIVVSFNGTPVRVGSGFSDADRHNIWFSPNEYFGKTAEISYMEVTEDGSLRHPVFEKWRLDL